MSIDTSAAYAASTRTLQGQIQFQAGQLQDNAKAQEQAAATLVTGTKPAATGGRGQSVDLSI